MGSKAVTCARALLVGLSGARLLLVCTLVIVVALAQHHLIKPLNDWVADARAFMHFDTVVGWYLKVLFGAAYLFGAFELMGDVLGLLSGLTAKRLILFLFITFDVCISTFLVFISGFSMYLATDASALAALPVARSSVAAESVVDSGTLLLTRADPNRTAQLLDLLQHKFGCCGVHGASDWWQHVHRRALAPILRTSYLGLTPRWVANCSRGDSLCYAPRSCCHTPTAGCSAANATVSGALAAAFGANFTGRLADLNDTQLIKLTDSVAVGPRDAAELWPTGCWDRLRAMVSLAAAVLTNLLIGLFLLNLLSTFAVFRVCVQVDSEDLA